MLGGRVGSPLSVQPMEPVQQSRLYLHVGLQKTGTTFLQELMANNRDRLKEAGYIYPFVRQETMFHAAVELRRQHERWKLSPEQIDGTWDEVLQRIRSFGGAGIVSHELLAPAGPRQVRRVRRDTTDLEVHVVVTARDLSRQATALWQEEVKNGRRWSFEEFTASLFDDDGKVRRKSRFWRSQDLASVLARWSVVAPGDRTHVVVAPRNSSDPLELWRRFAAALRMDPTSVVPDLQPTANESLGGAQIALLRDVVTALDGRLGRPHYAHVVKRFFAQGVLSSGSSFRPVTPPEVQDRLEGVARVWIEEIRSRGWSVHGDLEELLPSTAPLEGGKRHPDDVTAEELYRQVPAVMAELLIEIASLRTQVDGPKALPPFAAAEEGVGPQDRSDGPPHPDSQLG